MGGRSAERALRAAQRGETPAAADRAAQTAASAAPGAAAGAAVSGRDQTNQGRPIPVRLRVRSVVVLVFCCLVERLRSVGFKGDGGGRLSDPGACCWQQRVGCLGVTLSGDGPCENLPLMLGFRLSVEHFSRFLLIKQRMDGNHFSGWVTT